MFWSSIASLCPSIFLFPDICLSYIVLFFGLALLFHFFSYVKAKSSLSPFVLPASQSLVHDKLTLTSFCIEHLMVSLCTYKGTHNKNKLERDYLSNEMLEKLQ